jgi:hypothetical protein
MLDLSQVPDWLGAAVIGAVIAALGYVAKLIMEFWLNNRVKKDTQRATLAKLRALLDATRVTYLVQNQLARRLTQVGPELSLWQALRSATVIMERAGEPTHFEW